MLAQIRAKKDAKAASETSPSEVPVLWHLKSHYLVTYICAYVCFQRPVFAYLMLRVYLYMHICLKQCLKYLTYMCIYQIYV